MEFWERLEDFRLLLSPAMAITHKDMTVQDFCDWALEEHERIWRCREEIREKQDREEMKKAIGVKKPEEGEDGTV